jgi:hypothetical protein
MIRPILVSLALTLPLGCAANLPEQPGGNDSARQEESLTPDRAKAVLLDLFRAEPRAFMEVPDPAQFAEEKIEKVGDNVYRIGPADVDLGRETFHVAFRRGCVFQFEGQFKRRGGHWVAVVTGGSTALIKD